MFAYALAVVSATLFGGLADPTSSETEGSPRPTVSIEEQIEMGTKCFATQYQDNHYAHAHPVGYDQDCPASTSRVGVSGSGGNCNAWSKCADGSIVQCASPSPGSCAAEWTSEGDGFVDCYGYRTDC